MTEAATLITETTPVATPLAAYLQSTHPGLALEIHAGAFTPKSFPPASIQAEISAALNSAAVFDLGYRARIRVSGPDRLRWLNGMVSNTIQALPDGSGNYNFILNAQGRIQGDAYIYRGVDDLLIDTDLSQAPRVLTHLDHFIIMDDVELHPLDEAPGGVASCSLGIAGPEAARNLDALGLNASFLAEMQFAEASFDGIPITVVHAFSVTVPRYELWFAPGHIATIWDALTKSGAAPVGIDALESLRVLEGIPRYGVDITDRHLPQETSQSRALNFTKGCYLGQEIIERIRSRATVHRHLRQFSLHGEIPAPPVDLHAADDPPVIGQLSSVTKISLPSFTQTLALGFIRVEALERKQRIVYSGGEAEALESPPVPPRL
jgi:folate-binding protein YgfZ